MPKKATRYRQTAASFTTWLNANKKSSRKRRIEMFNAIADADYAYVRKSKKRIIISEKVKSR